MNISSRNRLERRFLERVSQTNRVKSSGVGGNGPANTAAASSNLAATSAAPPNMLNSNMTSQQNELLSSLANMNGPSNMMHQMNNNHQNDPPTPPWLKPPMGYRHGQGQAFAQSHLSGANARAAAAGRAMLEGLSAGQLQSALGQRKGSTDFSDFLLQDLQQRASHQNLLDASNGGNAAAGLFAAARRESLAQLASQQRIAGSHGNSPSLNNLMLKAGLSRDQLSQLARDRALSSGSLSHMMNRQNSFDALMSLDYQSLQSIDNLANLMQNNHHHFPETGLKNADFGGVTSNSFAAAAASNGDLSSAARRLASAGRMESLLKNMSNSNMRGSGNGTNADGSSSSATLSNLLQSTGAGNLSAASLLNAANSASAASLANLLRQDSSTGLSALRMQDGLNHRNSSVDDFLSLVAAGDIPHQDPNLLNVPLLHQQQQHAGSNVNAETAKFLAQHQQLLASGMSNSALANALASRGSLTGSLGNLQHGTNAGNVSSSSSNAATAFALAQARANDAKRKLEDLTGDLGQQVGAKRTAH